MSSAEINLLKHDTGAAQQIMALEDKLRMASWWSLLGLLILGLVIGSLYFIFTNNVNQLTDQNKKLVTQINSQIQKEGILLSLKERIAIANKALDADRPWGNLFPILTNIAQPAQILNISVQETGRVNMELKLVSVDDALTIVTNMISMAGNKTLRAPQLLSFNFKEDGTVNMGMSFIPAL